MQAPNCRACDKPHWGSCPEREERIKPAIDPRSAAKEVRHFLDETLAADVEPPRGGFAPQGQCQWCDCRREQNAAAQRNRRKGLTVPHRSKQQQQQRA